MIDDDQDDDAPRTVEDILAEWRAESPAIAAEMAERQRRIDRDETLQWARQRAAARATPPAPEVVMKRHTAPAAAQADLTQQWRAYVEGCIRKEARTADRVMAKAVGQVLLTEEKARIAEIAALRTRVDELQERIDQLEAAPRSGLRAV